jgi:hypothetical protein
MVLVLSNTHWPELICSVSTEFLFNSDNLNSLPSFRLSILSFFHSISSILSFFHLDYLSSLSFAQVIYPLFLLLIIICSLFRSHYHLLLLLRLSILSFFHSDYQSTLSFVQLFYSLFLSLKYLSSLFSLRLSILSFSQSGLLLSLSFTQLIASLFLSLSLYILSFFHPVFLIFLPFATSVFPPTLYKT